MFLDFTKNMTRALVEREFHLASVMGVNGELTAEKGLAVLLKAAPPVLYVVAFMNLDRVPVSDYAAAMDDFLDRLRQNLERYVCTRIIATHFLYGETLPEAARTFADAQEPIPDAIVNQVWWLADGGEQQVLPGAKQPKNVLDLQKVAQTAFAQPAPKESLEEIVGHVDLRSMFLTRSKDHKLTLYLIAVNIVIWFVIAISGQSDAFILFFANHPRLVLQEHQVYRLLTSVFIHLGLMHLLYNSLSLYIFGSLFEEAFGKRMYLALYLVSGVIGSLFSVLFTRALSAGASGAIFGLLGGILAWTVVNKHSIGGFDSRTLLIFALGFFLCGVFMGGVDHFAHLGGFLSGFVFAYLQQKRLKKKNAVS